LGAGAKDGAPQRLEALEDDRDPVQMAADQALAWVHANDAPGLLNLYRKLNAEHHWATPYHLKQFGPNPTDAVKPLIKQLETKDAGQRLAAALALGRICPPAKEAILPLQERIPTHGCNTARLCESNSQSDAG
jgi:HEAT repeat protein